MVNRYTSDFLVQSARRQGLIPIAGKLSTSDILGFVDDGLQDYIVPLMMSGREQFLVCSEDTTLVPGTLTYSLPSRAVSEAVQRVLLVDSSGNQVELSYVEPSVTQAVGLSGWAPYGFTLVDNSVFLPQGFTGYTTLRVNYFRRPNRVVQASEAAEITAVNKATGALAVSTAPSAFGASFTADVIQGSPGFRWRAVDQAATVAALVITLPVAAVQSVAVGDFVALAGESPIPQCPATLHPLLAKRVSCMCLEALGDQRLGSSTKAMELMEQRVLPTLTPRAQGAPRVVTNRYGPGWRRLPFWRR
jgi:hypothetical protein